MGYQSLLIQPLPFLLFRAGFEIDAITHKSLLDKNHFINREVIVEKDCDFIAELAKVELLEYDLIVSADDTTLKVILDSNLDLERKISFLPVISEKYLGHIASKINLSYLLSEAQILTPPFLVIRTREEAVQAALNLGFPVMIKVDFSGGGEGVFECREIADIAKIPQEKFSQPLLVQKKIMGHEIDLSGMFRQGELIYFAHSLFEKTATKFGPSLLRTYRKNIAPQIFAQVKNSGKVLGANGFVNLSAIVTDEGELYFFEADMRPNIWIDFARFIGDDPALRIKKYFATGEIMQFENCTDENLVTIAHFLRLKFWQILFNYHFVWRYMSKSDWQWLYRMVLCRKIKLFMSHLKPMPTALIHRLLPQKKLRKSIKAKIRKIFAFG